MDTRFARQLLATALLALAVSFGVSAQPRPPQSTSATEARPIRLRAVTFTPARGERPAIPDTLTVRDYPQGRRGAYIVQFDGPIEDSWKSAIVAAGGDILAYIPELALKVRMNPGEANQVSRLPHVVWVGVFQPAFKLPPDVVRGGQVRPYTVRLERGVNAADARAEITATGAAVLQHDGEWLMIAANAEQLEAVARVVDVGSIESFAIRRKHNEFGGSVMRAEVAVAAGYDGSTQTIAVTDSGLGGGTALTAHEAIAPERIAAIFNWPGVTNYCFETVAHDGPVDVDTGHGTHVVTSALGAGNALGIGRGTAPASRLIFQAVEDFVLPSLFCQVLLGLPPGYYLAGIPPDVSVLFEQSYNAGARVHSNSWGSAVNGAYTEDSASTDAFVWAHRDQAITISAGNSGVDANRDGIVDGGSINSPATAKNVITVGASEGDRGTNYDCDAGANGNCAALGGQNDVFTYGVGFGSAFSVNPLKDDLSAGNANQMAAFSSRGPTADGRIKPDVVAPGTWILSGYSDYFQQYYDAAPNPQNGRFQYDGWGEPFDNKYKYMGGTSMSTPLVAGAAAVVRDYYQKAHIVSASAALVKATLVNSAVDLLDENNDGVDDNVFPIPNIHEGWGRVDLAAAVDSSRQFFDESQGLSTGDTATHTVSVDASLRPLRVTVAWTDAPSSTTAAVALVNDLDLELIAPDGSTYTGNSFLDGWSITGGPPDRLNNLENVYVAAPAAGEWTIVVRGHNVPQGPQPFALVIGRESAPVQQLARVSVVATDADATEAGTGTGTFTLTRSGDLSAELTVTYLITGTATNGEDYVSLPSTVTFAAGSADAHVVVQPVDDTLVEANETVVLSIVSGETYGVRAPISATVTIVSDDQPGDLNVAAIAAPSWAAPGGDIVITETTRNLGSNPTTESETGFYLSANGSLDASDTFLGSRVVPGLSAGALSTQSTTLTLPAGIAGAFYVIAKADWNNTVIESSETNNTRNSAAVRIGPDLVVASVTIPTYAAPGGSIVVTDTVRNDGSDTAGPSVAGYYLSTNATLDVSDVMLGSRNIPSLPAGSSHQGSATVTIPESVSLGSYYVIARADDDGTVTEALESNNTRHAGTLKIGADLIVTAVSVPSTAVAGSAMTVTSTTRNQGGVEAVDFVTAFYLSLNSTWDVGDTRLGGHQLAALAAGQEVTVSTPVTVPASTAPGEYYVIAYADDERTVTEPVENNNTRAATTRVKIGPDLTIASVSAPLTGGAGQTLSVSHSVRNIGAASSPPTEAAFYLSTNTSLDAGDIELGRRPVPGLAGGVTNALTVAVTIPHEVGVGSYYVIAVADPDNLVVEAVESNNNYRSGIIRIGPDLTLTTLTAPTSMVAGTVVSATDTNRNTGGGIAASSSTSFYLSLNTTVESGDILVGSRVVPQLAPGGSQMATTALTIPSGLAAGTYYLIAVADAAETVEETSESNNTKRLTIKVSAP
jgi:subtilase family serine protease/subtilisin family serine protease